MRPHRLHLIFFHSGSLLLHLLFLTVPSSVRFITQTPDPLSCPQFSHIYLTGSFYLFLFTPHIFSVHTHQWGSPVMLEYHPLSNMWFAQNYILNLNLHYICKNQIKLCSLYKSGARKHDSSFRPVIVEVSSELHLKLFFVEVIKIHILLMTRDLACPTFT